MKKDKLLFYPENVRNGSKVFAYCQWLDIENITDSGEDGIIAVFFNHPNPECTYPKDDTIIELSKKYKVYNLDCNNTRKSHVAKIHKKIFGYNADVNKGYKGIILKKSELQYQRNEIFVNKVIPDKDSHHMKYFDTLNNGYYNSYRIPYFDGDIPCVVNIKRKDPFDRKSRTKLVIKNKTQWFHPKEIALIKKFCRFIGLDYGELDVLRDLKGNRIYIIDVNDKPGFAMLGQSERVKKIFTNAFKQMIYKS